MIQKKEGKFFSVKKCSGSAEASHLKRDGYHPLPPCPDADGGYDLAVNTRDELMGALVGEDF